MLNNLANLCYVFLVIALILGALYFCYLRVQKKNPVEAPLRCIHVFPDYPKSYPYECKSGQELQFVAKGYSDLYKMIKAPIVEDKIIWGCTKGNGTFKGSRNLKTGNYTGSVIKFITPNVEKDMLIFVSAHYENFTDATWIKVIK